MKHVKTYRRWARLCSALAIGCCLFLVPGAYTCASSESVGSGSARSVQTGEKTTGTWVVELYVCGTNLESEHGAATADLQELTSLLPPDGVTFVIQTGGASDWQNEGVTNGEIDRFVYDKDGLVKLDPQPDADMAATDTFAGFLQFAQDKFPADHRILIVWNHGGGTVRGACYDERTQNIMGLNQMQDAVASVYEQNTDAPAFDIIGFDCCLMATYGVANTFAGYGRYLVASQETEPANGWNYKGIVQGFQDGVGSDPLVLAKVVCDTFMDGCREYDTADAATLSVTDLSKLPQLRDAYERMGDEAIAAAEKGPKAFFSQYGRNAEETANYGGNTRDTGYTNMLDMGDFARRSEELLPATAKAVEGALDTAVVYRVNGTLKKEAHGLSCYYPYEINQQQDFENVRAASDSHKALYRYLATGKAPEGRPKVSFAFEIDSMEDLPVDADDDGTVFCKLTPEQMDNLSTVRCDLVWYNLDKDSFFMYGNDANVDMNWDTGLCKDNFDGTWPMLDHHPIYIDVTEETDEYVTYAIPIKLNGKQMNLFASYDLKAGTYTILGARAGLNEKGASDRNLVKLKAGDTVTTQQYAFSLAKNGEDSQLIDRDTFQLTPNFGIEDETLPDGTYAYVFDFITPTDDYAMSAMATYEVKNGAITTTTYEP